LRWNCDIASDPAGARGTAASISELGAPVASMHPPPPIERPIPPNVSTSTMPDIGKNHILLWDFSFSIPP